jgi:N-acetylneuraminate synthase
VGADAVKFQLASEVELYGYNAGLGINKHFIKPEWLPILGEKAKACNIEFMCTGFSVEGYAQINKYVSRHKISSCENLHTGILKTLSYYGKPVIVSTGCTHIKEIQYIRQMLARVPVTFLYCVVNYPCHETMLEKIEKLRNEIREPVGFSDHSTDYTTIPVEAVWNYGATIVEKHFNPLELTDTPDAPHSINREQFSTMVQRIKGRVTFPEKEEDAILKHKRRVMAVKSIKEGEKLSGKNCGIYRSLNADVAGLSPVLYEKILSEKAVRDFEVGESIHF